MQAGQASWAGWPRPRRVSLLVPNLPGDNRDGYGDPKQAWQPVADVWASIRPLSGREIWQAQQVQADVTHAVRLRYRMGVTPDMQVGYAGRTLRIVSVINVEERNRTLELLCIEQVD